jgi:hypothetical protein
MVVTRMVCGLLARKSANWHTCQVAKLDRELVKNVAGKDASKLDEALADVKALFV